MDEDNDTSAEKKVHGERKRRMKRFYNNIRHQIEFYLGDVNLSKDRFFSNLLQQSPYIDIETILKCNKIKKLTEQPEDIVKALEKSTLLSVTEDEKKVYRTVPVAPVDNADESTIYVEDLPLEVDHDWLKSVFNQFGEIVYVSIPHYKTSRKLKGFGFIQFDSPESANKAIEAFRSENSCLSNTMEPEELLSVQTFEGEKEVVVRTRGEIYVDQIKSISVENKEASIRKRKRKSTEELTTVKPEPRTEELTTVKPEPRSDSETAIDENSPTNSQKSIKKIKIEADEQNVTEEMESESEKSKNEGGVNRPHRRKRKKAKKNEQVQTFGMQILLKSDWKKLRNKYLEEQRKRMHEVKQQLRQLRLYQSEKEKMETEEDEEIKPTLTEDTKATECRVKFTPGVIIKLELDQPVKDVKHFKNEVKRYADVEYIDVNENSFFAYFRCASNEIANQVIGLNKWPNMTILKDDEEQAYWEKIKNDRKQKYDKKIRCNSRGKNKLMKKVEAAMVQSHVRFPE